MEVVVFLIALFFSMLSSGYEVGYFKKEKIIHQRKDAIAIFTILLINNVSNTLGANFFSLSLRKFIQDDYLLRFMEVFVFTAILLVFAELIPKNVAINKPQLFYNRATKMLVLAFQNLAYPIFLLVERLLPKLKHQKQENYLTVSEIIKPLKLITDKREAPKYELLFIQEVLSLIKSPIRRFISPFNELAMLDVNSTVEDAISHFKTHRYRRYLVYRESRRNIVGYVDVVDLIGKENTSTKLREFLKPVRIIPSTLNALDYALSDEDFCIVYDEFGNISGIITKKSMLKHILNLFERNIKRIDENTYILKEPIDLGFIEEITGIYLGDPNMDLSEFITQKTGSIPDEGDTIEVGRIRFTILEVDEGKIEKVKMELVRP